MLSPLAEEAISNYTFTEDRGARVLIDDRIRTGQYITYKAGDEAIFIEKSGLGDAWHGANINPTMLRLVQKLELR